MQINQLLSVAALWYFARPRQNACRAGEWHGRAGFAKLKYLENYIK